MDNHIEISIRFASNNFRIFKKSIKFLIIFLFSVLMVYLVCNFFNLPSLDINISISESVESTSSGSIETPIESSTIVTTLETETVSSSFVPSTLSSESSETSVTAQNTTIFSTRPATSTNNIWNPILGCVLCCSFLVQILD